MPLASSAWVPMTISTVPSAMPFAGVGGLLGDEARELLAHLDRKAAEPVGEALVVLARQQRRGRDHRHLQALTWPRRRPRASPPRSCRSPHRRRSAGPSAARVQVGPARPRWRAAGRRSPDRGSARRTPPTCPRAGSRIGALRSARSAATRISLSAISRMRSLSLAFLACHAPPPSRSSSPLRGRSATEQLDVLDRQVQPVAAGVFQRQAFMRRAQRGDHLQPVVAADAVIDMHDQIAGRQRSAPRSGSSRPARFLRARGSAGRPARPVRRSRSAPAALNPCSSAQTARCSPPLLPPDIAEIHIAGAVDQARRPRPSSSIRPCSRSRAPSE
jgi:hypothetical protein